LLLLTVDNYELLIVILRLQWISNYYQVEETIQN